MYCVGDKVCYPMHGAGVIDAIEEKEVLGCMRQYYVLRFELDGLRVMVPVDGPQGLRSVIGLEELKRVLSSMDLTNEDEESNWNHRYRVNADRIRTGDVREVAGVVGSLKNRERRRGLSAGEKRMLQNATRILLSELMMAGGLSENEARDVLETAI